MPKVNAVMDSIPTCCVGGLGSIPAVGIAKSSQHKVHHLVPDTINLHDLASRCSMHKLEIIKLAMPSMGKGSVSARIGKKYM